MRTDFHIRIANVSPEERFALEEFTGLFCDPERASLRLGFLHGTQGVTLDPDTGRLVPVTLTDPPPMPRPVAQRRPALAAAGFSLIELLGVIAIVAILAGMLLPATVRAYHHAQARSAWVAYWHAAQATAFLQDDLPAGSSTYWLQTPDQAWQRINGARGITWSQVTPAHVNCWRESTRALSITADH